MIITNRSVSRSGWRWEVQRPAPGDELHGNRHHQCGRRPGHAPFLRRHALLWLHLWSLTSCKSCCSFFIFFILNLESWILNFESWILKTEFWNLNSEEDFFHLESFTHSKPFKDLTFKFIILPGKRICCCSYWFWGYNIKTVTFLLLFVIMLTQLTMFFFL